MFKNHLLKSFCLFFLFITSCSTEEENLLINEKSEASKNFEIDQKFNLKKSTNLVSPFFEKLGVVGFDVKRKMVLYVSRQ